jgi:hypothetical protein
MEGQCRRALAGRRPQQPRPLSERTGWPKNPRELAGPLRRAQAFLRALGTDIAFSAGRPGRKQDH